MIGRTNAAVRRFATLREQLRISGLSEQPGGFPEITVGDDGSLYIAYVPVYSPSAALQYRAKKVSALGEELWDVALRSGAYAGLSMTVFAHTLYYISTPSRSGAKNDILVKISAETGGIISTHDVSTGSHDRLEVLAEDDVLYMANGFVRRWRYSGGAPVNEVIAYTTGRSYMEVNDGILYVSGYEGYTSATDIATGNKLWQRYLADRHPRPPAFGFGIDRRTKTLCGYTDDSVSRFAFDGSCFVKDKWVPFYAYNSVFSGDDGYIYRRLDTANGVCLVKENGYGAVFWVAKMPSKIGPVVIVEDGSIFFMDGPDIVKAAMQ